MREGQFEDVPKPDLNDGEFRKAFLGKCYGISASMLMAIAFVLGFTTDSFEVVSKILAFTDAPSPTIRSVEILLPGELRYADGRMVKTPGTFPITKTDKTVLRLSGVANEPIFGEATGRQWVEGLLVVDSPRFSGASLSAMKDLNSITRLEIGHTGITKDHARVLPDIFPAVEDLSLVNNPQLGNDAFIGSINRFPILRALSVAGCSIDDGLIEELGKNQNSGITFLDMSFTLITDFGLQESKDLIRLERLRIVNCRVSTEAKSRVKELMPRLILDDADPPSMVASDR